MADILNFPRIPEKYSGSLIDWIIEASDALRGKTQRRLICDSCGVDFPEPRNEKSDRFPKSDFCSIGCRDSADEAAEDNRRTDVRPGSY